ncbi:MAG: dipeptidase [Candidatus Promineifilaceae bacterium]
MPKPVLFDGHNDTLTDIFQPEGDGTRSFFERSDQGQLDLPRARAGGLAGGVFAIYTAGAKEEPFERKKLKRGGYEVPYAAAVDPGTARTFTAAVLDFAEAIEAQSGGQVAITRTAAALAAQLEGGVFSMVLGIEGAAAIAPDLRNLPYYYERGVRVINPVWSRPNAFGFGVPFRYPSSPDTGPGLTAAGRELVAACNELGIVVDLAHLNKKGFWQVAGQSTAPLVCSHTAVHTICPMSRNLTDDQIKAIGESGGLIGLYYMPAGIRPDGKDNRDTPLAAIVEHVNFIVDLAGIDHVALGSDFDGAPMPYGLADAAALPHLFQMLAKAGYDEADLAKIGYKNWLRVLRETWRA